MKILTIGTGVIGTIFSWVLTDQGHDVTHYVRKGKSESIDPHITIDMLDKRKGHPKYSQFPYTYQLTETITPDNDYNYILIAVRVCQLEELLQELSGVTGKACVVIFTGNWLGPEFVEQYLPKGSFIFADPIAGGSFHGKTLVVALNDHLPMGEINGTITERLTVLEKVFNKAGIKIVHQKDILHWHWLQFALNAGMWPALVRMKNLKSILKDKSTLDEILHCTDECIDVCIKRGINIDDYPEIKSYTGIGKLKAFIMKTLFPFMLAHSEYHRRCMAHALDDPKEIKTFYDNVLNTGRELGVDMPYYSKFQKDIEAFMINGVQE